jgi:cob(I)alamin adenosyltransferase
MAEVIPGWDRGRVQVYTGDGKGKTTAAFGLALRAAGRGLKVFVAQFAKGRDSGEVVAAERFSDLITVRRFGKKAFVRGEPDHQDRDEARRGMRTVRDVLAEGTHRLVILDEINIATYYGLVPVEDLLKTLAGRARSVEVVLTGRNADPRVLAAADLVTEMRAVKHYFAQGTPAREGIEE